ncbi:MAG: hypothetical protein HY919_09210 [Elusimicrobia bacterium]|nr:hypothetical protein [Elusimicrobiota bacterium]
MKKIILAILMLSILSVKTDAGFNFGITNAIKKQSKKIDEKIQEKIEAEINAKRNAPVLSWMAETNYTSDGLNPETGDAYTTYYFRVKYTDIDNSAPKTGYPKLFIKKNGIVISTAGFTMITDDANSYVVGRIYSYSTLLSTGDYTYYFEAYDSAGLLATGGPTTEKSGPTSSFSKKWTVMCYESYDNDLESSGLEDLEEMASVGSSSDINWVVQFDRHPGYSNEAVLNIPNWTTAKRFYVKQNSLEEKVDLGEVNMASSATLSGFIQWAVTNYPAEKYVLIFGDHGMSWEGFGADETTGDDDLTLEEIDMAMLEATQKTGINKFDLIGFDACLQADIQTLHIMKQYGKVYVASEETEPGYGWQYDKILDYLKNNPNTTSQDLGRKIADSYKTSFDQVADRKNEGLGITLSVIDLEKIATVETALNGLASALKQFTAGEDVPGNRPNWLEIAKSKEDTQNHGGDTYALDIYHLARNLMDNITEDVTITTDDMVRQRAFDCMTAIDSAVLYRINGTNRPFGYGISVYYPPYQNKYKNDYGDVSFAEMNLWAGYLTNYLEIESNDNIAPTIDTGADEETIDPDDPNDVVICTATITHVANDNDIASINFTLGKDNAGEVDIYGNVEVEPDEDDIFTSSIVVSMSWGGEWFAITGDGGTNYRFMAIKSFDYAGEDEEENNIYFAQVPAVYLSPGETDWNTEASTITLSFSVIISTESNEWEAGEFISAFEPSDTGPTPIDIKTNGMIRPIYQRITATDDRIEIRAPDFITIGSQGLDITLKSISAGNYKIGYTAVDYSENWAEDYADITVQ